MDSTPYSAPRKRGRPPGRRGPEKKLYGFMLPPDLVKRLKLEAISRERFANEILIEALEDRYGRESAA